MYKSGFIAVCLRLILPCDGNIIQFDLILTSVKIQCSTDLRQSRNNYDYRCPTLRYLPLYCVKTFQFGSLRVTNTVINSAQGQGLAETYNMTKLLP